jgi:NTP pyrophosphatase (non-canonical NTP hydrolase)
MLAMIEELGEVATEVALLEQIGPKAGWNKEPSTQRLATEITHLLNRAFALANRFGIDLSETSNPEQANPEDARALNAES